MVRLKCEVIDCSQEQSATTSLHTIPKNEDVSKKWMTFLQTANDKYPAWTPDKKVMVICSRHFAPTDFRHGVTGRRFIIGGHYPTIVDGQMASLINHKSAKMSSVRNRIMQSQQNGSSPTSSSPSSTVFKASSTTNGYNDKSSQYGRANDSIPPDIVDSQMNIRKFSGNFSDSSNSSTSPLQSTWRSGGGVEKKSQFLVPSTASIVRTVEIPLLKSAKASSPSSSSSVGTCSKEQLFSTPPVVNRANKPFLAMEKASMTINVSASTTSSLSCSSPSPPSGIAPSSTSNGNGNMFGNGKNSTNGRSRSNLESPTRPGRKAKDPRTPTCKNPLSSIPKLNSVGSSGNGFGYGNGTASNTATTTPTTVRYRDPSPGGIGRRLNTTATSNLTTPSTTPTEPTPTVASGSTFHGSSLVINHVASDLIFEQPNVIAEPLPSVTTTSTDTIVSSASANTISSMPTPVIDMTHDACNRTIKEQMSCIAKQRLHIESLESSISALVRENELLRRKSVRVLAQKCKRQQQVAKRKNLEIVALKEDVKRIKFECSLPDETVPADKILSEMIQRRHSPKNGPYSATMKEFAFNAHYISPKGYSYLRETLPGILPDKSRCNHWTRHVHVAPGLIEISLQEIARMSSLKTCYYSLQFDETFMRQQALFNGSKIIGQTDYGNLVTNPPPPSLAKSALVCLVTEINGHKSFPVAYALTDGLKAKVMAEIVSTCVRAVQQRNGNVLNIAFDGLKANFSAAEILGAKLAVDSPDFQPYIEYTGSNQIKKKVFVIPDACHMFKLVRNTLDKCEVLFNGDGKAIRWLYIERLLEVQEREQLRAANKLTTRHVNYHQKKMNVKLCVQVLSDGTATGIDFCRNINIPGFEDSEATSEFLRMNNFTFDLLNTRPFGEGNKAPLSKMNKYRWSALISIAKSYYIGLRLVMKNELVPLHSTIYGTCVKGIISALTSVEQLMESIERNELELTHLPTYRLGQDPLELFFGSLRRRFGCNDNPNALQLTYALRAMLCFKLRGTDRGNCEPQEDLLDCVPATMLDDNENLLEQNEPQSSSTEFDYFENGIDIESFLTLSLFVENIVVYIAGFVGRKLKNTLDCTDCALSLASRSLEDFRIREDCLLLIQKDHGGLFKPSEDLVQVCKITERLIRVEQNNGIFNMNSKKLEVMLRRECIDRSVFNNLHTEACPSKASFVIHGTHRLFLITEICRAYLKTRLNYMAKRFSLEAKPISNRSKLNKLVHISGC